MSEDLSVLLSFFPDNWVDLASETDAFKGLRKDKDVENYMRTFLIYIACIYSMRETTARAKLADLVDISDVALLDRLKKAIVWLTAWLFHYSKSKELPYRIKAISR